jgi:hypothetical protein
MPASTVRGFDDALLNQMIEPLTVRIERINGSNSQPVPLPESEDGSAPGTNWTKDLVRGLETWLVTEWSGGGAYTLAVTDSTSPQAIVMRWKVQYDIREYPIRVPPPLQGASQSTAAAPQAPVQLPTQQGPRMTAFSNGLPQGGLFPPANYLSVPAQPPNYGYAQPTLPPAPMIGSPQWGAYTAELDRRNNEKEMREMRERDREREREVLAAQHKAELDRLKAEGDAKLLRLEQQLEAMRLTIAQNNNAPTRNAETEALKEALAKSEARADADKRERDAERRDAQIRELISNQQRDSQRMFDELKRQFDTTITALTSKITESAGSPLISMMQEQARQQADAIKEVVRQQTTQFQQMQAFMMSPKEMMSMAKESAADRDNATFKVGESYAKILDMQQRVTENALQMQPQGSGAIDMVRDGIAGVKEVVEKYANLKSIDARMIAQSQVQAAHLNAQVYIESQRIQAGQAQPQPQSNGVIVTPPPRPEAQLSGPTVADVVPSEAPATPTMPSKPSDENWFLGRTDAEWFTPALMPEVERLRADAAKFVKSINNDPPTLNKKGDVDGTSPAQAATYMMQAAQMAVAKQVIIPALKDLLFEDRVDDFIAALLPNVAKEYRDHTAQALVTIIKAQSGVVDEDEAEDDDEGDDDVDVDSDDSGDDNDDVRDGSASVVVVAAPPPKAKPAKPQQRART